MMPLRRGLILILLAFLAGGFSPVLRQGDRGLAAEHLSTPELIEVDYKAGKITADQRLLYLLYAVYDYDALPRPYQSEVAWYGTQTVLELKQKYEEMDRNSMRPVGFLAAEFKRLLAPQAIDALCDVADGPNTVNTTNFRVSYGTIGGGLSISNYTNALETAYSVLVSSYGWPKPPYKSNNSFGLYPVQISSLGGGLYGYVTVTSSATYTGIIGDNPNTSAIETQAAASCMVLNSNYSGFPGGALFSLQVTTAHEFTHSIQFGVGDPAPDEDLMWLESTAAYAEDEVYDNANDNYQYLYPDFNSCLGQYTGNEYSNWLFFRYVAEASGGANKAGGGEDVIQGLFQNVAQGQSAMNALNNVLSPRCSSLADIFHSYAIASKFMKTCPTGAPYCFEEGSAYISAKGGLPGLHGSITGVGGSFNGSVKDHYGLNWVGLPTSGTYSISLQNTGGGQLRASIVAETASGLTVTHMPAIVGMGNSTTLPAYQVPAGATKVVAVITNQSQPSADPITCTSHSYTLSVGIASTMPTLPPPTVYLPLISRCNLYESQSEPPPPPPAASMQGKVTSQGVAQANRAVDLRYYNGASWSTYSTDTTDGGGNYEFTSLPPLSSGQSMLARWTNSSESAGYLWGWWCNAITSSSPSSAYTCNFDLKDIPLLAPASGTSTSLPRTFYWTPRGFSGETYEFDLYNEDGSKWYYVNAPLGDRYTLTSLPSGFSYGTTYYWEVWVYNSNGFGISLGFNSIIFNP